MAQSAHREAVDHLRTGARALGTLPVTRERPEQAIDLRLDLRNALAAPRDDARAVASLREAERIAETLGDKRRLGGVLRHLVSHPH